jgi:hypothetical protein
VESKRALKVEANTKDGNVTIELFRKSSCLHPLFGPAFTPLSPLSVVSAKLGNLIKSQYEMLKLSILMHKVG